MKKIIYFFVLIFVISSCEKEPIYPTDQLPSNVPSISNEVGIGSWGRFVIVGGTMYVTNNETGQKIYYDHFGENKDSSSLRWGGSYFDIESIVRNQTSFSFWKPIGFPGYGRFVLNDDTTKKYSVYYIGNYRTIVEDPLSTELMMGGSARPFSGQTLSLEDSLIAIHIQESQGSIAGYNSKYWTRLILKKTDSW